MNIAVSRIAALCGHHDFKSARDAKKELVRRNSKCKYFKNQKLLDVKTDLFNSSMYLWYCRSANVTGRMRIIARCLIDKICKKHKMLYNKPYSYFCKERGLYREVHNTDEAEKLLDSKIYNRQRKINKKYSEFIICGSIDGETDSHVIEIKTRSSPIDKFPLWEKIQLSWYAFILQKPGILFAFHNGSFKKLDISLEQATKTAQETVEILKSIIQ